LCKLDVLDIVAVVCWCGRKGDGITELRVARL
jgi:hypothetical protein